MTSKFVFNDTIFKPNLLKEEKNSFIYISTIKIEQHVAVINILK